MPVEQLADALVASTRAMASPVNVTVARSLGDDRMAEAVVQRALGIFHSFEEVATRFNPMSPLMRANASPTRWHRVPPPLYDALRAAYDEYLRTRGVFDPRVITHLVALGYDDTLRFDDPTLRVESRDATTRHPGAWRPKFRDHKCDVLLGDAVDLGGIGKGLAVRWASELLHSVSSDFFVEAGGDCVFAGHAPDGDSWRVGVEDPFGGSVPLAVLAVGDVAVTTSSIRRRHWRVGATPVHHLIDPRTGRSGGQGLMSVTVVGRDPATSEVDAKVLFLAGRDAVAGEAARTGAAALWCDVDGVVGYSDAMRPYVTWERG